MGGKEEESSKKPRMSTKIKTQKLRMGDGTGKNRTQ